MHIATDSFSETGGAAALIGRSRGYDYQATTLGVRAEMPILVGLPLVARGMLGWQHVFGDVTPTSVQAFASAPGSTFTVAGAPIATDSLMAEAGFDWQMRPDTTLGLYYSGAVGSRDEDQAIKGRLDVSF
jgi:outer membrane autotransporter protein